MITYTVSKEGKVYNARGGDTGKTLIVGDVLTVDSPKTVLIGDKVCYQISAPVSGYFLADRVKVVLDPNPPDPLPVPTHVVEVFIDGVSVFKKELFS